MSRCELWMRDRASCFIGFRLRYALWGLHLWRLGDLCYHGMRLHRNWGRGEVSLWLDDDEPDW